MINITEVSFSEPRRPILWPDIIERIGEIAESPSRLYLVGGIVRDTLRGRPGHDIDLATPDNGLKIARRLANKLGGAYYPVDPERGTGRAIIEDEGRTLVIDVASFRGETLYDDLQARDFTINAIAVQFDRLDQIIDPFNGQSDLFDKRVIRQCQPTSIADDPVRALRAIRQALSLNLHLDKETTQAVKAAAPRLLNEEGRLRSAERVRDEVFKILGGVRPIGGLRLLNALGLLDILCPISLDEIDIDERLAYLEQLAHLLTVISNRRTDNTASKMVLGVAVMILDRHRKQLQEHFFEQHYGDERSRAAVVLLGGLLPGYNHLWKEHFQLSNEEDHLLTRLEGIWCIDFLPIGWIDNRAIYRYYQAMDEAGVDGVIVKLAEVLARQWPTPDAKEWGSLLDDVASPLLDGYFRRYQEVVAPPPLITGHDLMETLSMKPGREIGEVLAQIIEGQAAGELKTKKQAMRFAEKVISRL